MAHLTVTTFKKDYLSSFVQLNREWIEKYFKLESMDLAQLENPYELILNPGGEIFFLLENEMVVGTCAMVLHGDGFELAKMAVAPNKRGLGYGDLIIKAAIEWAESKNLVKITLLSNTILAPAITLYKKHGFQTIHLGPHPDYERCNIIMELALEKPTII